jgi:hypothetical protein
MEHQIYITLGYDLATGDVNLNEIIYRLKELRDRLMLRNLFGNLGKAMECQVKRKRGQVYV